MIRYRYHLLSCSISLIMYRAVLDDLLMFGNTSLNHPKDTNVDAKANII